MSELVSNSLRHNAAPHGQAVVVRVALERGTWRLEVEDPGGGRRARPRSERAAAGRLGMNLVQSLSECWGVEHAAERGTRAWAYLPRGAGGGARRGNGATGGVGEPSGQRQRCSTTSATSSGREKNGECEEATRCTVPARADIASCTGGGTARSSLADHVRARQVCHAAAVCGVAIAATDCRVRRAAAPRRRSGAQSP